MTERQANRTVERPLTGLEMDIMEECGTGSPKLCNRTQLSGQIHTGSWNFRGKFVLEWSHHHGCREACPLSSLPVPHDCGRLFLAPTEGLG